MSRPALLALSALLLAGACRVAADSSDVGSPDASGAGAEAPGKPTGTRPSSPTASGQAQRASKPSPLIAVASIDASEAQPCERLCGSLGDCLLAGDGYTPVVAGGLELECLDLCVHSPDSAQAKTEFLACGRQSDCGALERCAERSWTALAEVRQSPGVGGVAGVANDPCKVGCRWFYSCFQAGLPPGEAYLDSQTIQQMENCMDHCETATGPEREMMVTFADCLPSRCSSVDRAYECWNFVY